MQHSKLMIGDFREVGRVGIGERERQPRECTPDANRSSLREREFTTVPISWQLPLQL
jgi:hypothetical protein